MGPRDSRGCCLACRVVSCPPCTWRAPSVTQKFSQMPAAWPRDSVHPLLSKSTWEAGQRWLLQALLAPALSTCPQKTKSRVKHPPLSITCVHEGLPETVCPSGSCKPPAPAPVPSRLQRGCVAHPLPLELVWGSGEAYCAVWSKAAPANVISGSERLPWLEMDTEEGVGLPAAGGADCGPGTDALIASRHLVE